MTSPFSPRPASSSSRPTEYVVTILPDEARWGTLDAHSRHYLEQALREGCEALPSDVLLAFVASGLVMTGDAYRDAWAKPGRNPKAEAEPETLARFRGRRPPTRRDTQYEYRDPFHMDASSEVADAIRGEADTSSDTPVATSAAPARPSTLEPAPASTTAPNEQDVTDVDWEQALPQMTTKPPPSLGIRTANELDFGPAPAPIVDPLWGGEGVTVIYGPGGVGKGVTAAYLAREAIRDGHVILIVDFENHPREWGQRLRGLGLSPDERLQVYWTSPWDDEWTDKKGLLPVIAARVREQCDALGVTAVIVDSYTTASSGDATMGGAEAAQAFFHACAVINRRTLVLAHVAKGADRFPANPFGSGFVHNLARSTWAVEQMTRPDESDLEANIVRVVPDVITLEFRHMKSNIGRRLAPVFRSVEFSADGRIDYRVFVPTSAQTLEQRITDILGREGPLTVNVLVSELNQTKTDEARKVVAGTVRVVLGRWEGVRFARVAGSVPPKVRWELV